MVKLALKLNDHILVILANVISHLSTADAIPTTPTIPTATTPTATPTPTIPLTTMPVTVVIPKGK